MLDESRAPVSVGTPALFFASNLMTDQNNTSQQKATLSFASLFSGLTLKDVVLLLAFLGIGSNEFREWIRDDQVATREVIQRQTTTLDQRLAGIQETIQGHSMAIRTLSSAIVDNRERIEEVNDSLKLELQKLEKTLVRGLSNIDGYFDARFDSLLDSKK